MANRYSRIFHHISINDVKKNREIMVERRRVQFEKKKRDEEYIVEKMKDKKSDWRNELKEQPVFKAVPVDTGKMTSSQSFAVFTNFGGDDSDTGLRFSIDGGLGGTESLPIFNYPLEAGGTVPAIDFSTPGGSGTAQINLGDFPLSGYAMPLGGKMSRSINQKKSEEINKELESSEEFTKKIEADALMKARVDSNIMTGNNLQDITTSFENVKVPFDQGKFSSYMRTNIEQFQTLGAYEAEIEVLENKIRKTEEAQSKNYAAKIVKFEKQIKQIKEKQRKIPVDSKYPKTKISQAQFDALLEEISPADYIEGKEILKNNFLGQLEKQKEELNKKFDSLVKKYPQFNGDPERILGKWNGSVQIPIFDSDNNEIKPIGAEIGKQLEMIRLKKNIFNRMIYDSFDPSSVTYTMPPTVSDTSEPSPKEIKSSGFHGMANNEKSAPMTGNDINNLDNQQIDSAVKDVGSSFGPNIGTGIRIFGDFLTKGYNERFVADRKYLGKEYMNRQFFPNVSFDRNGTYVKDDVVVGSGQPAKYNENTGMLEIRSIFDFKTNAQEVAGAIASEKGEKADWASRFNRTGSKYALDAIVDPLPGVLKPLSGMVASHLISIAKFSGKGNLIPVVIKISPEELKSKNKKAYEELVKLGVIPKDK